MPMTGSGMAAAIKAKIEAVDDYPTDGHHANFIRDDVLQAFCEGVVQYIQQNAEVDSTGTVTSGTGAGGGVTTTGDIL